MHVEIPESPEIPEESFPVFWCLQDYLLLQLKPFPFNFVSKMILSSPFSHVIEPDLLHEEYWAHLLKQSKHTRIPRNWQAMTSQSAHLSHQFPVDPQGSTVHCSASAQLKKPFVVTCQKNLASLSAGDSCSLVHASLLLSGYLNNMERIWP